MRFRSRKPRRSIRGRSRSRRGARRTRRTRSTRGIRIGYRL